MKSVLQPFPKAVTSGQALRTWKLHFNVLRTIRPMLATSSHFPIYRLCGQVEWATSIAFDTFSGPLDEFDQFPGNRVGE
jgi:hypothetical protein